LWIELNAQAVGVDGNVQPGHRRVPPLSDEAAPGTPLGGGDRLRQRNVCPLDGGVGAALSITGSGRTSTGSGPTSIASGPTSIASGPTSIASGEGLVCARTGGDFGRQRRRFVSGNGYGRVALEVWMGVGGGRWKWVRYAMLRRMGLRNWIQEVRTEPDIVWVAGKFHVTASSTPAFASTVSSGWWTGVLVLPNDTLPPVPVTALKHHGLAPVEFWPHAGQVVDVQVVPTDLTLIKFSWVTATSHADQGMLEATALAARLAADSDADRPN
jgi:hypothetical protein